MHKLDPTHAIPSGAFGFVHMPVAGLHAPTVWHPSLATHVTALVPVQVPLTQEYVSHRFGVATLHDVPLGSFV